MGVVPVTVVTGAIGSGKSSLIRRSLRGQTSFLRVAVVKMRFAVEIGCVEEDVDDCSLAEWIDAFETQEHLCLCCNPREDFELVLEQLSQRSQNFDRLIVETTGLADPACLWPLLAMREMFVLDSVVCVVNSSSFFAWSSLAVSGVRSIEHEQIAFASVVAVVGEEEKKDSCSKAVSEILPLFSSRIVTRDDSVMMDAVLRPKQDSWSFSTLLSLVPDYFSEPTPFTRHQDKVACASLVGVDVLTEDQLVRLKIWIQGVPWIRVKAHLYVAGRGCVRLDGLHGILSESFGSSDEVVLNKIAFVGFAGVLPESFALKADLEASKGILLHPTVLYSAPAPLVDTTLQRLALFAVCLIVMFLPNIENSTRIWCFAFVALYFWLSRQKRR